MPNIDNTTLFSILVIFSIALGLLNWVYWKRKGYTSIGNLILGIGAAFAILFQLAKLLF